MIKKILQLIKEYKLIKKVRISDIKIPYSYIATPPTREKMANKKAYYERTGVFMDTIILNNPSKKLLVDGYTSFLLAKEFGHKYVYVKYI